MLSRRHALAAIASFTILSACGSSSTAPNTKTSTAVLQDPKLTKLLDGWFGGALDQRGDDCGTYIEKCLGGVSLWLAQGGEHTRVYLQRGKSAYDSYLAGKPLVSPKVAQESGSGSITQNIDGSFSFDSAVQVVYARTYYENCTFSDNDTFACSFHRDNGKTKGRITFHRLPIIP